MQLDWLQLWRELAVNIPQNPNGELMQRFKRHAEKKTERPDSHLDFVLSNLGPADSVLDIGAGSGRWTVRLAAKCRSVTAVEPSDEMAALLEQNLKAAGLSNVNIIRSTWEEAAVDVHDLSVSAHAIYGSPDLAAFVRKMEEHSRKACYLALRLPPADGIIGELSQAIHGRRFDSPNAMLAYNALYSLGIYCNVRVEEDNYRWSDTTLEEAFRRAKRHLRLDSESLYDTLILSTLARRLEISGDRLLWPDGMRSLLLWWKVGVGS